MKTATVWTTVCFLNSTLETFHCLMYFKVVLQQFILHLHKEANRRDRLRLKSLPCSPIHCSPYNRHILVLYSEQLRFGTLNNHFPFRTAVVSNNCNFFLYSAETWSSSTTYLYHCYVIQSCLFHYAPLQH